MNLCPHFFQCSGCEVADIFHPPIRKEALSFFAKHQVDFSFISDGFEHTRFKAKLAVRQGPRIGLFKKKSHEVISIPGCLVHHPSINQAVNAIREEMLRMGISPYEENPPRGTLRYIQLFAERSTGRIQLVLSAHQGELGPFCDALLKRHNWHSIWINWEKGATNRILSAEWEHIYGDPFLFQSFNGLSIPFHPGAFAQAHLILFEKMVQKIESWVDPSEKVLELYAGVGAIGLSLAKKGNRMTLVENNPFAFLSFQQTRSSIPYLCIDAAQADFEGYDLTIVDPPRKGLGLEIISKIRSSRLIYISCRFESFKKDSAHLFSLGWEIKKGEGYLFFAGTDQIEILALFERAGPKSTV